MVLHICWCCTLENNTLSLVLQLSRCGHEFNICAIILPEILLSSIKCMISCQILLSPYSFIKDFHIDTVCIVKQPRVNNIIYQLKYVKKRIWKLHSRLSKVISMHQDFARLEYEYILHCMLCWSYLHQFNLFCYRGKICSKIQLWSTHMGKVW